MSRLKSWSVRSERNTIKRGASRATMHETHPVVFSWDEGIGQVPFLQSVIHDPLSGQNLLQHGLQPFNLQSVHEEASDLIGGIVNRIPLGVVFFHNLQGHQRAHLAIPIEAKHDLSFVVLLIQLVGVSVVDHRIGRDGGNHRFLQDH